jgi:pre-mRNA-splicing factor CDC5/CEF1
LEGPKRRNNEEDDERRKRLKKSSDANASMNKNFQPEQAEQIQRLKEAEQISNRSRLSLPAPQVSERELEEIVKIGHAGESARQLVDDGANESGRGLLGEYSALAHAKNARTPRTAPQGERSWSFSYSSSIDFVVSQRTRSC